MRKGQNKLTEFNGYSVGDKVHFIPDYAETTFDCENGFVRSILQDHNNPKKAYIFVVYEMVNNWENKNLYTARLTLEINLSLGWVKTNQSDSTF